MSADTFVFELREVVKCLSYADSLITVETGYLQRSDSVCVLRYTTGIPNVVEAVRVPGLGEMPMWKRERFCYCDEVSSLILYDEGTLSVEEGMEALRGYIGYCVEGDCTYPKNRYLFK